MDKLTHTRAYLYSAELSPALSNVSFVVKGGQKIGICGRTGSGKSSTIMALFRAMDQSLMGGKISLDGVDISDYSLGTSERGFEVRFLLRVQAVGTARSDCIVQLGLARAFPLARYAARNR